MNQHATSGAVLSIVGSGFQVAGSEHDLPSSDMAHHPIHGLSRNSRVWRTSWGCQSKRHGEGRDYQVCPHFSLMFAVLASAIKCCGFLCSPTMTVSVRYCLVLPATIALDEPSTTMANLDNVRIWRRQSKDDDKNTSLAAVQALHCRAGGYAPKISLVQALGCMSPLVNFYLVG